MYRRTTLLATSLLLTALVRAQGNGADTVDLYNTSLEDLMKVAVTGSHFAASGAPSSSPIVVLEGPDLVHPGSTRLEELLNRLPQFNAGLTLDANGASVAPITGTATADLRGIGAFRTLVLIDGKRATPGDPVNPSTDLNTIPTALIKRVEVLTGGASAIYGSDAVAGVVNVILDSDFTGFKVTARGGIHRDENDRREFHAVAQQSGIAAPTGSVADGGEADLSVAFGRDVGDGHVTAYAGYRRVAGVTGGSRDFSACTLAETGSTYRCLLDGTTPRGQFVADGIPLTLDANSPRTFRPLAGPADLFNSALYQDLQRPDERFNAGALATFVLSGGATLYSEVQFTDDDTRVQYEPAGTSAPLSELNVYGIPCNDPLLSAAQVMDLCTRAGLGAGDTASVGIGRSNVEGGSRTDEFHHQSYRLVAGLKGKLSAVWSYDASLTHGRVDSQETLRGDLSMTRLANALDVVSAGGVATCQSVLARSDVNCVPYDIFTIGGVTPAAANYIAASGRQSGFAQRSVASAELHGDLGKYGLRSPWAKSGISVAGGLEYRIEQVRYEPDAEYASGDLLVTGPAHPTDGTFRAAEAFTELRAPLVEDLPFAKRIDLNVSDRYAHYTPQGNVNAYGIGLEWRPSSLGMLRTSVGRAVRAPNAFELYTAQVVDQVDAIDPCAGATPTATAAQCARSGVTAAQYGRIAPQSSVNVVTGGNPKLTPETANTITAGLLVTPLPSVTISADYWRIKVDKYVGNVPSSYTLDTCLASGDRFYCGLIQRAPDGSLSGTATTAGKVIGTRFNTGSYGSSGIDFDAGASVGSLSFHFIGSLVLDNPISVTPGVPTFDCTGYFGPECSATGPTSPVPRWRHQLRATWAPRRGDELSATWRRIGALRAESTSGNSVLANASENFAIDSRVGAYDYLDVDAALDLGSHVRIQFGVNNLTGLKPPVVGYYANPQLINGNLLAGLYDTLGRYVFVGFTAQY